MSCSVPSNGTAGEEDEDDECKEALSFMGTDIIFESLRQNSLRGGCGGDCCCSPREQIRSLEKELTMKDNSAPARSQLLEHISSSSEVEFDMPMGRVRWPLSRACPRMGDGRGFLAAGDRQVEPAR